MAALNWYWRRLRAMGPVEVALRLRKKWFEFKDAKGDQWPSADLSPSSAFPKLPEPASAPEPLRESLKRDAERVASGRLRFFGHLDVQADTPPNWQRDYLACVDMPAGESAFKINHRELPDGAAIKPLWEPSRWYGPVRLAQACWLLGNRRSGEHCLDWLEDWVANNPPYTGWHWTSALESGMRLIAFTWIDAFLTAFEGQNPGDLAKRLAKLRADILPAHAWFTWRHRTFGSSANNHLLGELCGLALANARWPGLATLGPSSGHARQAARARDAAAVPPRRRQLRAGAELSVFRVGILLGSPAGSCRRRRAAAGEPRENRCAAWAGGPVLPRGAGAIRSVGLRRLGRCLRHAVVRGRVAGRGRVVAVDRRQRRRVAVSAPHARTVRCMPENRRTRY